MEREELLRRLEERLARGEIGEKTYLDIKARYDAMSEVRVQPDTPTSGEEDKEGGEDDRRTQGEVDAGEPSRGSPIPPIPPIPPVPGSPAVPRKSWNGDLGAMIERTIESAMEQVAANIEVAFANKEEARRRMDEVNRRIQEAMGKVGPRIEDEGRTCVIRGSGTVPGGRHFKEFKCAGSGTVTGDLFADEAHIAGACQIEGGFVGKEFHASGRAEVAKDVEVEEFHVSGKANVGGDVRAEEVHVSGSASIGGGIVDAEEVVLSGVARVGGSVKTEEFTSRGQFQIGGGIEAEDVEIRLAGPSRVPSIRAKDIEIRRSERNGELTVESIEGEEIYLEGTKAGLVRGESVHLGPYCSVHTVEADDLEVHETSTFKERHAPSHRA